MKKFIIISITAFILYFGIDYLIYQTGIYIDLSPDKPVSSFVKTEGKEILLDIGSGYQPFEIKGVDLGVGIPGYYATEFAIDKKTYLRWFKYIQDMGANTIRVYTILQPEFYEAVFEFNHNNAQPLYIIHGLWVDDYVLNSHVDAYDDSFLNEMLKDSRTLVDIIHGKRRINLGDGRGSRRYKKDISPWLIGYILGVEWEDVTVAYTDEMQKDKNAYSGTYMSTTWEATPFEALLAQVGDRLIEYESDRYHEQRLVAFSNWPTTDPFDYPDELSNFFMKIAKVDVEHIILSEQFIAGTFASYHIYPYYPDYLNYMPDKNSYVDLDGKINTYYSYLKMINEHHSIPVIISEFGVPSSRGRAQRDANTGRSQGMMSEHDQGRAIVESYHDIMAAGCAGSIIFTWQDEWFKRTWNTMHSVDLNQTAYWSDYQTNEQYFGLLSFDPGKEKSISYVDGDISEWSEKEIVARDEDNSLSMKYDEKFIYFMLWKKGYDGTEKIFIPIDTTEESGSKYSSKYNLNFERDADFLIVLDGTEQSRILVQERYDVMRVMFLELTEGKDPYMSIPKKDSPIFKKIKLNLQHNAQMQNAGISSDNKNYVEAYETGFLIHGNANPEAKDFNSLADYCINGEYIELKIPWQLLNFSNPSQMEIHDDYYEHYGVEYQKINKMYIGIGTENAQQIAMKPASLKGWGKKVTYHERLKESYYIVKELWAGK